MKYDGSSKVIESASIVTPEGVLYGSIKVEKDIIAAVSEDVLTTSGPRIDADGSYVLPGFVDFHSDILEEEITMIRKTLVDSKEIFSARG